MIGRMALILIAVALLLALLGKLKRTKVGKDKPARRVKSARQCPSCGAWVIKGEPCSSCGRGA